MSNAYFAKCPNKTFELLFLHSFSSYDYHHFGGWVIRIKNPESGLHNRTYLIDSKQTGVLKE